jgi:TonB family protein
LNRIIAASLALVLQATAFAQTETRVTRIMHFQDSNSDRIPSVTAVPQYPERARRDRIEGEATVCFLINAEGEIVRPAVRKSSHRMFARPSLKAIRNSSYEPLPPHKKMSQVKTCRTYRFRLTPVAIEDVE